MRDMHEVSARSDDRRLDEELERWIAAAVISPEQARAIRDLEADAARRRPAPGRIPLVAEALGFLGGALAVIAGIVAMSRFWQDFSTATRLVLVGVVTALLLAAGRVVRREGEPALAHLGSFLWVLATGGAAFWAGILGFSALDWEGADLVLLVGVLATVVAAVLWRWRPAPLQHAATLITLAVAVAGMAGQVEHVGGRFIGIALWALGVIWVVLAWIGVIEPVPLGYALGGVLAVVAGRILGDEGLWADGIAIATAVTLLGASVPTRSMVLLWVGVVGVFLSVPTAITRQFGDSLGAPVVLFLAGMSLIGLAIVASRLVREVRAGPPRPARFRPVAKAGAVGGVVVAVVALTVGLTDIKPVPAFASLRRAPDASITGSIAFVRHEGDRSCVYLTAASGAGDERRLLCEDNIDDGPFALAWNGAGRLVLRKYADSGAEQLVVDPSTGAVLSREPAGDPGKGPLDTVRRSSDGAVIEVRDRSLVLRTSPGNTTTTVFETQGPRDYRFDFAVWSPDGHHVAVVDSERRLLVVDVDAPSPTPRLLATGAGSPAWAPL